MINDAQVTFRKEETFPIFAVEESVSCPFIAFPLVLPLTLERQFKKRKGPLFR